MGLCLNSEQRVFCGREIQKSIADSVHQLFSDLITKDLNLDPKLYTILNNRIIFHETGSQISYGGLQNHTVDSVKSMEGCTIAWIEEAQRVSEKSWELLIPTIRADDSEIWVSFNPDLASDPTYQRFIVNTPPNAIVVKVGWQDNPYFNKELVAEKDYLKEVDYDAYSHVWEGNPKKASDAQIFKDKFVVERFAVEPHWRRVDGLDFGFSTDPTAYVVSYISEPYLFVRYEAGGHQIELDDLPRVLDEVPEAREHVIRADNSRPESISYLNRHGYGKVRSCKKWTRCVEDGIEYMRSFKKIVIHPDCVKTAQEFDLYSYKVDRQTEEVMRDIVDKHNHYIDGIRYSLEPHIIKREIKQHTIAGGY